MAAVYFWALVFRNDNNSVRPGVPIKNTLYNPTFPNKIIPFLPLGAVFFTPFLPTVAVAMTPRLIRRPMTFSNSSAHTKSNTAPKTPA